MVVRWRYVEFYLWSNQEILCFERVVHVHYLSIDDLGITTPLKKKKQNKTKKNNIAAFWSRSG